VSRPLNDKMGGRLRALPKVEGNSSNDTGGKVNVGGSSPGHHELVVAGGAQLANNWREQGTVEGDAGNIVSADGALCRYIGMGIDSAGDSSCIGTIGGGKCGDSRRIFKP
jgi:hypothetical protein